MVNKSLEDIAFEKAAFMIESGMISGFGKEMDIFEVTDLLIKLELEKKHKDEITDKNLDYNDEIVEIEDVGVLETIDISVSGDNLFYCNDILTKNSFGIPAIADFMVAIINSEELYELNQIMIKQLKNRYRDLNLNKRFVVGVDRSRMTMYDLEESAQEGITDAGNDSPPPSQMEVVYKSKFGGDKPTGKKSFGDIKV